MNSRIVKGFIIVVLGMFLLLGGLGIWTMYNQDKVFVQIKDLINENLHGTLDARDFKFSPLKNGLGFTFSLFDVTLDDTLYTQHRTHLLEARRLNVSLDLSAFFDGKIKVKNLRLEEGTLFVFTRKDGYSNLSIFVNPKKSKSTASGSSFTSDLLGGNKQLSFQDFNLHYTDSLKGKYFEGTLREVTSRIAQKDSVWKGNLEGDLYVKNLKFIDAKRGFLNNQPTKAQIDFSFNNADKVLLIHQSRLEIASKNQLLVSGILDFKPRPGTVSLHIVTDKIPLPRALKLIPEHLEKRIARVKILPVVKADIHVKGSMGRGQPRVDIAFVTGPFDYTLSSGNLKKLTAVGTFTNQADPSRPVSNENSRLKGTRVKGYFETIPIEGSIVVNDLNAIKAVIESTLKAQPSHLNALLDPARYRVGSGTLDIGFRYQGSLKNLYDPETNRPTAKVGGTVDFSNLSFSYLPQNVNLNRIKGQITFDEDEFKTKNIQFSAGKNTFFISGNSVDLLAQLFGANTTPRANLNVKVPDWELGWLDFFLKKKGPDKPLPTSNLRISQVLDKIIDRTEVVATLESNRVHYKQFSATRVRGKMSLTDTKVNLNDISMNAFGGSLKVSGYIDNIGTNGLPFLHAEGKLNNTDVQSVFYSMGNFGQTAMTNENLKGKLSADFSFETNLRDNTALLPESMRGRLDIALTGAEVNNFEPFQKINSIVFKNRNFEQVRFAPIRKQFVLKGQEIAVNEMQIESNVLTLFVDGTYSFGTKTDLSIQLPLQNLKRRDSTYQLAQHDLEYMKGMNIFLRAVDEGGKVNIKYDPLKRMRKDKETRKEKEARKEKEISAEKETSK